MSADSRNSPPQDIFADQIELTVGELTYLRHAVLELYIRGGWCPGENRLDFARRVNEKLSALTLKCTDAQAQLPRLTPAERLVYAAAFAHAIEVDPITPEGAASSAYAAVCALRDAHAMRPRLPRCLADNKAMLEDFRRGDVK